MYSVSKSALGEKQTKTKENHWKDLFDLIYVETYWVILIPWTQVSRSLRYFSLNADCTCVSVRLWVRGEGWESWSVAVHWTRLVLFCSSVINLLCRPVCSDCVSSLTWHHCMHACTFTRKYNLFLSSIHFQWTAVIHHLYSFSFKQREKTTRCLFQEERSRLSAKSQSSTIKAPRMW